MKEWDLGVEDQRELFLTVSNIMKEHKGYTKESFKFLTRYLATFTGDDAHTMNEAKEAAVNTIIEFVKVPDMYQLDIPAVAQLEKDAKYALVYQLIEDNEVEPWVVKAITAKLIDCKIDQMNQVVIVRYALSFTH
nr:eukaryotic translation initiation factor 3 subunit M-like [Ipomoea batatas]